MKRLNRVFVTLFSSFLAISCNRNIESSGLGSLENVSAGQRVNVNQCRGSYQPLAQSRIIPPIGKIANENKIKNEGVVREALTAIPEDVQRLFIALKGKILITDGVGSICTQRFAQKSEQHYASEGLGDIRGCIVFFPASDRNLQILNIILAPDENEIRHSMGRIFGGFLAELVPRLAVNTQTGMLQLADKDAEAAKDSKSALATTYLREVSESSVFSLQKIGFLFGDYGLAELDGALKSPALNAEKDIFKYVSFENSKETKFTDAKMNERQYRALSFIAAESFDSYFCNISAPYDAEKLRGIKSGARNLSEVANEKNSRQVMFHIFPNTYREFESAALPSLMEGIQAKIVAAEKTVFFNRDAGKPAEAMQLVDDSAEREASEGLSLAGNYEPESPWWAGTKAFFGSAWDNTGGAVGRGYNSYSKAVGKAVDEVYDGNVATTAAKAVGKVGSDAYGDYYQRTYDQTGKRIETLQQGGMSAGKSQAYGVALAVGDLTGVTELAEATEGFDIDEKRELDGWERAQKAANGTAAAAGTAAGVMSMTSRVATAVKPVSAADDLARAGASKADDAARAGANSGLCLAEFVPHEQVVQSNGRVDAKKPAYHDPGTHQPGTAQKLGKEIIPDNAEALYKTRIS